MNRLKPFKTTALIALATLMVAALITSPAYANNLMKSKSPNNAWLGVYMQNIDKDMAEAFDLKTDKGVLVDDVVDDSPADDAGLMRGDVIVKFDDEQIDNSEELSDAVAGHEPGDKVTVAILRNGEEKTYNVELGKNRSMDDTYSFNMPPGNRSGKAGNYAWQFFGDEGGYLGVSTIELTDQLADYFGAKSGVLVSEVEEDSPAAAAGLKAGDIIVKVEGEDINSPGDLHDLIRDYNKGDKVDIEVLRKGNNETLTAELDETKGSTAWGNVNPQQFFNMQNMPNMQNIPGIHRYDDNSTKMNEDMNQLRDEMQQLKEELSKLKEQLK